MTRICVKHSGLRQLAATAKTAGSVDGVGSSVDGVGSSVDGVGSSSDGGDRNSDGGNGGKRAATTAVRFGPLKTSANLVIPLICAIAIYLRIRESKINTGV